jgi:DNA-binding XRE family transcriptional regulator
MTPTELAAVRERLGYSQKEMAHILDVGRRTYQSYEAWATGAGLPRAKVPTRVEIAIRGIEAARKIKAAERQKDIIDIAHEFADAISGVENDAISG